LGIKFGATISRAHLSVAALKASAVVANTNFEAILNFR